jgi:hypothetical protein
MDPAAQAFLFSLLFVVAVSALLYFTYSAGMLDPIIGRITVYMFKGKALAEQKKLQAQGLKAGKDFVPSDLPGNQQAKQAMDDFGETMPPVGETVGNTVGGAVGGTLGGIKKQL